jgi:hypothetical protein
VVDQGNAVAPLSTRSLDVEASGSLDVELKLGRSTWHVVDQGNAVAPLSTRSARRRGLGIARRGAEARPLGVARGRRGKRSRSHVRGGVVDVEAWGSLDVERKIGRSMWPWSTRETQSLPCPRRSARRRGLGITRRGAEARPLDVAMVDQGNVVAPCLLGVLDVEA